MSRGARVALSPATGRKKGGPHVKREEEKVQSEDPVEGVGIERRVGRERAKRG